MSNFGFIFLESLGGEVFLGGGLMNCFEYFEEVVICIDV